MYLASQPTQTRVSVRLICDIFGLSSNHVNKVVHHLARLSLIQTKRGKNGGFSLAVAPHEISLAFVIRQLEGDEDWIDCHNPSCIAFPACKLNGLVEQGKKLFYAHLSHYTIADLVDTNKNELQAIFIQNLPSQIEP